MAALQRSRRVFPAGRLEESTENETDGSHASLDHEEESREFGDRIRGIRSSWNGNKSFYTRARDGQPTFKEVDYTGREDAKGKMVDIGLESTIADDDDPPADLTMETPVDSSPPAFQKFRSLASGPTRF